MQRSIFLAKLIGPFLAVCGVALIFNADAFRAIGNEIVKSPALIYIAGVLALVTGEIVRRFRAAHREQIRCANLQSLYQRVLHIDTSAFEW